MPTQTLANTKTTSAPWAVVVLSAKEVLRSRYTVLVILLSFVLMLALFISLDLAFSTRETRGDLVRANLGVTAAMGMMSIAFAGTAVPLVTYRERGTYRLLGATPIKPSTFVIGQIPVRAAIAAAEILTILVVMAVGGATAVDYLPVFVVSVCGFLMFMALGILLGARGRNTDLVMQVSLLLPIVVIFTSGIGIPIALLPEWAQTIIQALPTTWYMNAINHWTNPDPNLALHLAGMVAVAVSALTAAAAVFDWGKE